MSNRTKTLKNFLFQILRETIVIACGLILPRLFIVSYGSEINGLLTSLAQFLCCLNLFEAGAGRVVLQALYKPLAEDNWDAINGIMSATNWYFKRIGRMYLAGLLVLAVAYPLVVDSSLPFWTVFGTVLFSGLDMAGTFYFMSKYSYLIQIDGKIYIIANLKTLTTVLSSLSKVILIYRGANIVLILAAAFVIQCIPIFYIVWYARFYPKLRLDAPPNYGALSQRYSAMVHQVNSLVFSNTDVMILTIFCGLKVVSVYSIYILISSHLENFLSIPLSSVNFIMGQTYQTDRELYIRRADRLESYYSALLFTLFSVALFLYLPFIHLYTAGVTDINYVDPWLAALIVLNALLNGARSVSINTYTYAGRFRDTVPHTIAETTINLTVSLAGVYFLGIYGVLLGTTAALAFRTNQSILYANHKVLERSARRTYAIYGVNTVLFFLVQFIFRRLIDAAGLNTYPRLVAAGFATTLLASVVFFGGQTLLFPHCRELVREGIRRLPWRGRGTGRPEP